MLDFYGVLYFEFIGIYQLDITVKIIDRILPIYLYVWLKDTASFFF
jgi:hypothetical protein